ncbi:hypothetical protein V8C35DRAFT_318968 [Trichoderma chlorosporum]
MSNDFPLEWAGATTHEFEILLKDLDIRFVFSWQSHANPARVNPWQTVDIFYKIQNDSSSPIQSNGDDLGFDWSYSIPLSPLAADFVSKCVSGVIKSGSWGRRRVAKLIVPNVAGQIVRSDIVPLRFLDCEFVESSISLATPLKIYHDRPTDTPHLGNLGAILDDSAGALILQDLPSDAGNLELHSYAQLIEPEVENRMSFPWIIPPSPSKTLVIVEGSRQHPNDGGTGPNIYLAAMALGIKMVVLDERGHWLEGPEYEHWREAFIPLDLPQPPDIGFTDRIVRAVSSYSGSVDGIITFCDSYQSHVAAAAQRLRLAANPAESLRIATDKYETSIFEGRRSHLISSTQEALKLAAVEGNSLYPCIVKPCNGWSSEGVSLVNNHTELIDALGPLNRISGSRHGKDFVVEKYCSGPEFDANFVLLDGEILFFEVSDDFPKSADSNGSDYQGTKTFIEMDTVFPSILPKAEVSLLRVCFHNTLLRLGLRDGIMHLEGRIDNSAATYRTESGLLDLVRSGANGQDHSPDTQPEPWLIEINPRPPGMKGTQIIESTYGVDYWGLGMLIALRDKERVRVLCHPYKHGPQYTCVMVFIPTDYDVATKQGIFDSDDVCEELLRRRPDLAKNVSRCGCLIKKGQKVAHPSQGVNSFLAYFNVFSRKGRSHALQLAKTIREEVQFSFI